MGEVLRRLPGVTTPGAPGRGGPPRMRGLGGGFTQILIDGQRLPPGFGLDSLTPEQIERIEVLRAPTAETGARAIAGTINIITREGFKARYNDVQIGSNVENGSISGGVNWSHNNSSGPLTYNLGARLFFPRRSNDSRVHNEVRDAQTYELREVRDGQSHSEEKRFGSGANARLSWRLNEQGDTLTLMPSVFHTEFDSDNHFNQTTQVLQTGRVVPDLYDSGTTRTDGSFTTARLGTQWRQRVGLARLELNGNVNTWRSRNNSLRDEFRAGTSAPLRSFSDLGSTRENSLSLNLKARGLAGGTAEGGGNEHDLVFGAEAETTSRRENRVSMPDLAEFGDNLQASVLRVAAYGQDEWQLTPNWGTHFGLRWEGIRTQGDSGAVGGERPVNNSSVWTPLAHAVWKPDPKSRDQVRISLTRSYRNPSLGQLIARPSINRLYPTTGANTALTPDTAGNPALKPELATGIDVALERYLDAGGVLSANVFHRQISNLIRGVVGPAERVSWSNELRYVRRQSNIGDATTSGIELEAKFRLDQLLPAAPQVELKTNVAFYSSRVDAVPGPKNRLDEQATATANVGADYRFRGTPLTLGGNLNWVPGYTTRTGADTSVTVSTKRVWDAYALWTFSPTVALRMLGNNLAPSDYIRTHVSSSTNRQYNRTEINSADSISPNYTNVQVRLELKL